MLVEMNLWGRADLAVAGFAQNLKCLYQTSNSYILVFSAEASSWQVYVKSAVHAQPSLLSYHAYQSTVCFEMSMSSVVVLIVLLDVPKQTDMYEWCRQGA